MPANSELSKFADGRKIDLDRPRKFCTIALGSQSKRERRQGGGKPELLARRFRDTLKELWSRSEIA